LEGAHGWSHKDYAHGYATKDLRRAAKRTKDGRGCTATTGPGAQANVAEKRTINKGRKANGVSSVVKRLPLSFPPKNPPIFKKVKAAPANDEKSAEASKRVRAKLTGISGNFA
jgi:hypothetical protein